MRCQGYTAKGRPCRNLASANGYCHLHGGVSRQNRITYNVRLPSAGGQTPIPGASGGSEAVVIIVIVVFILIVALAMCGEAGMGGGGGGGRQCDRGQPCGRSCISWDRECHK